MSYEVGALDALRDFGIHFTEEPGCRTRGSINFSPRGVAIHHTGTNSDITAVLRDGRAGLSGPLCNIELRRNGHVHVIALGRANHAGAGDYRGLSGNSLCWGIEPSSDGKTWTDAQRHMYPLVTAALCRYSRIDEGWVFGHKEYAGYRGKWDPGAWDMNWHRSRTGLLLRGGPTPAPTPTPIEEDDDMRISLAPGEEDVFHIEPTIPGHSAIGVKKVIVVLNSHGGNRVPIHIYFQSEGGPGRQEVWGGGSPWVKTLVNRPGGWMHVRNEGKAHVGGRIVEVR